jgi:hypothetical protein
MASGTWNHLLEACASQDYPRASTLLAAAGADPEPNPDALDVLRRCLLVVRSQRQADLKTLHEMGRLRPYLDSAAP